METRKEGREGLWATERPPPQRPMTGTMSSLPHMTPPVAFTTCIFFFFFKMVFVYLTER